MLIYFLITHSHLQYIMSHITFGSSQVLTQQAAHICKFCGKKVRDHLQLEQRINGKKIVISMTAQFIESEGIIEIY